MDRCQYMVFVQCSTYNQSQYIKQTLDGFCVQQTDFPFVCGIIDDASTDGEQEVLMQYLNEHFNLDDKETYQREETVDYVRIYAQHKTNTNCFFLVVLLKTNHYQHHRDRLGYVVNWENKAKYYAACEGDDYWIDNMRLQKQADFLESHPNHSMIFNAVQYLYPDGHIEEIRRYDKDMEQCPVSDLILGGGGFIKINSLLYRREFKKNYPEWAKNCPVGDSPLFLVMAICGDIAYRNEIGSCYRISFGGSWTDRKNNSSYKQHYKEMKENIAYWNTFDKWTNRKYHKYVVKKNFRDIVKFIKFTILFVLRRNKQQQ